MSSGKSVTTTSCELRRTKPKEISTKVTSNKLTVNNALYLSIDLSLTCSIGTLTPKITLFSVMYGTRLIIIPTSPKMNKYPIITSFIILATPAIFSQFFFKYCLNFFNNLFFIHTHCHRLADHIFLFSPKGVPEFCCPITP